MKRTNVNVMNNSVNVFWKSKPGPVYDLQKIKLGHHGKKKIIATVAINAMGDIEWIKIRT
jgi:hypothetical protein